MKLGIAPGQNAAIAWSNRIILNYFEERYEREQNAEAKRVATLVPQSDPRESSFAGRQSTA